MRELLLMRHAEAEPMPRDGTDFGRELTGRGRRAAAAAALRMLGQHGEPDCILYSPAARTAATAEAVRSALSLEATTLRADARIYLATPDILLQAISEAPDRALRLLLVAHNPAISELAAALQADAAGLPSMAPAEFRHCHLSIADWRELRDSA